MPGVLAAGSLFPFGNVISEVNVLRSIEFLHKGRRYRGRVAPVLGGAPEFAHGAWFVSMNGGPERRVFEAHHEDADTAEFRHRIVIATWLTDPYNRRDSADRRRSGRRSASFRDRRSGPDRRA
ncbi:MAG: hypothetical protein HKN72_09100 [Gemmatimonadetes bacterium]|nr:hypothetical protein [Gemmatimonadota bacterium]